MAIQLGARVRLLALLVAFYTPALRGGAEEYDGKRIMEIRFDPVRQPLPRTVLDGILPLKVNGVLHMDDVTAAIQRLFATGRYADIAVDALAGQDGVILRFLTEQSYFIGNVSVSGVPEPPNKGQLVAATKLRLGTEFVETDVKQATENLLNVLRSNGFYSANIASDTPRGEDTGQIDVDFKVDAGKRARFELPLVTGEAQRPAESIVRATKWKRLFGLLGWKPVTQRTVQEGISGVRRLYQKSDFLLATVNLERLDYHDNTNTVQPTIHAAAGPVVRIDTSGARISRGKLQQLVPVYQERTVDKDLLVEGKRNLLEYFQAQGYFDSKVDFDLQAETNHKQVVEYVFDLGARHKVVHLDITGNRYFDNATLRERMFLTPATPIRFRHGRYSQRFLDRDLDSIRELYRSNGFRDVRATARVDDNYQGKTADLAVFITVEEGQQWFVASVDLIGPSPDDREYLLSMLHSAPNQPFSELNIASDRDGILTYYYNNGYPDASFEWSHEVAQPKRANLKFVVEPGGRKYVRDFLVSGLERTRPSLVYNRIHFGAGDPLSQSQITEGQRRLDDLGVFAKVETAIQNPDGEETEKYVLYQLEEARKYSINTGFGAQIAQIGGCTSCLDAAPVGTTGFSPRVSVGVTRINFMGLGHTIGLQTRVSNLQSRAVLTYFAPQLNGNENFNLTFTGLFDESRDKRTFSARRLEGSVQLGQKLSRANSMQYRFTYRRVNIGDLHIEPLLIPLFAQPDRVGIASATFIQDRRDDPADSHRGVYNTIDVGYASRAFGSQRDFTRLLVRNATYHRLSREIVLARSLYLGYVQRIAGQPGIALPERIFSGGSSSQRGFPENQAGPRDPVTGFPLGGNALLLSSVEARFPLYGDNLGGVLFHDAGNVYSDPRNISFRFHQRNTQDFNYMVQSIGFGIRYKTPIGPVRVDLAFSPNSPRFNGLKGTTQELLCGTKLTSSGACDHTRPLIPVAQRIGQFQFHFSLGQAF